MIELSRRLLRLLLLRPAKVEDGAEHAGQHGDQVQVPVRSEDFFGFQHPQERTLQKNVRLQNEPETLETYLLDALDAEEKVELEQGEGDGDLCVDAGLGGQVIEALGQVHVARHPKPLFVHVAEVEHGLGVVLLIGR